MKIINAGLELLRYHPSPCWAVRLSCSLDQLLAIKKVLRLCSKLDLLMKPRYVDPVCEQSLTCRFGVLIRIRDMICSSLQMPNLQLLELLD